MPSWANLNNQQRPLPGKKEHSLNPLDNRLSKQAMPLVKSIDSFIQQSLALLETAPSTTRISITYGSLKKDKAQTQAQAQDKVSKTKADNFVSFKVYDPTSGALYKLKTHKVKDLSRALTALGPHGVQVTKGVKKDLTKPQSKAGKKETLQIRGFSSVLANAEIEEEIEAIKEEPKREAAPKKNKKKKGKR